MFDILLGCQLWLVRMLGAVQYNVGTAHIRIFLSLLQFDQYLLGRAVLLFNDRCKIYPVDSDP